MSDEWKKRPYQPGSRSTTCRLLVSTTGMKRSCGMVARSPLRHQATERGLPRWIPAHSIRACNKRPHFRPDHGSFLVHIGWPIVSVGPHTRDRLLDIFVAAGKLLHQSIPTGRQRLGLWTGGILVERLFHIRDQFVPFPADAFLKFRRPQVLSGLNLGTAL